MKTKRQVIDASEKEKRSLKSERVLDCIGLIALGFLLIFFSGRTAVLDAQEERWLSAILNGVIYIIDIVLLVKIIQRRA